MDDITKNQVKAILIDSDIHEPESLALIEAVSVVVDAVTSQKTAELEENIRQAASSAETLPSRIDEAGQRFGQALSEAAAPVTDALAKVEMVVIKQLSDIDKKLDQAARAKADSVAGLWADIAHDEVKKRLNNEGRRSALMWSVIGATIAISLVVTGGYVWSMAVKTGSIYQCQTFHGALWCKVKN